MKVLNPDRDLPEFFRKLRTSKSRLLLLDYDGTLAPFTNRRDEAVPYPGVRARLEAITADSKTRLVIISGRPVSEVSTLLSLAHQPEVWGCHGAERHRQGKTELIDLNDVIVAGFKAAAEWTRREKLLDLLEEKPVGLAFHWRGLDKDTVRKMRDRLSSGLGSIGRQYGLLLKDFDGGLELRPPGVDKGEVVRSLLAETDSGEAMAYLGDDLTDEDAFRALDERGLAVLVRPEQRETAADIWIKPPEELLAFLDDWLAAG
jgi:trehalose-phosphatase